MICNDVKKVILVFKTHLDIGFTASAAEVLRRYRTDYIPAALKTAEKLNSGGEKKFVWTVGSYLIRHYLDNAEPSQADALDAAVRRGDVRYHALPCTTHTELMDADLFGYGLSIAAGLDRRYGMTTAASKMTDVPGHTAAMVPLLAAAGVEYLHLGVNTGSRVPDVPPLFRWSFGGDEIVVSYSGGYGEATILPNGTALEFCHSLDNAGPPSAAEIDAAWTLMAERYPGADITAGTLDDFLPALREIRGGLPVIEQEIGDSWIHGVSTDPQKVSAYRRLLRLKDGWLKDGRIDKDGKAYSVMMENLMLIAEHTWGMDCKKHLLDFTNWRKADFQAARRRDETSYSLFSVRNAHIFAELEDELREYRGDSEVSSYSHFEASHAEQRAYLKKASAALPSDLGDEAERELGFVFPEDSAGSPVVPGRSYSAGDWSFELGTSGEIVCLGRVGAVLGGCSLGLFEYQTFGGKEVGDCFFEYGRDLKKNFHWAECDFGKPGLRYEQELRAGVYLPGVESAVLDGDRLVVDLAVPEEASESYGCPRDLRVVHVFGEKLRTELYWRGKDAVRSPEAVWFQMKLGAADPSMWRLYKLGRPVSPLSVVRGGNRRLHCAERLVYDAADGFFEIDAVDSPLLSLGGRHLYDVDYGYGDPGEGFRFLLYNNRWGTNFKQWYEDDGRFVFETAIQLRHNALSDVEEDQNVAY